MNIIRTFFEFLPLLLLFIGVLIIVRGRRRLARMIPAQGKMHVENARRESNNWHDEMMDPTNLAGWTNPDSGAYVGRRDDD